MFIYLCLPLHSFLSLFSPLFIFNESLVDRKQLPRVLGFPYIIAFVLIAKNAKTDHFNNMCTVLASSNTSPLPLHEDGSDSAAFIKIYTQARPT